MEKEEEETREVLLPHWQGSGSLGITLDENDEGVFVKQLVHDSPAAQTGVVREGDQIVGATVYFDQMSTEEVQMLLKNMGHHTVGLKLQRKGDRSPLPGMASGMSWSHEALSPGSPDVVLSGDDEDYKRIYTKKIKPRLKSEDLAEMEHTATETQSRTITVTRKVTAYTVDVTGSEGARETDFSSPEFKIKIPRQEFTERSRMEFETPEGKTVIRTTNVSGKTSHITDFGTDMQSTPSRITLSGTTGEFTQRGIDFGVSERDRKVGKPDVTVSGFHSHGTLSSQLIHDGKNIQVDFKPPEVTTTEIRIPSVDVGNANGKSVQIEVPGINTSGSRFQSAAGDGSGRSSMDTGSFNVVGVSKFSKFGISAPHVQSPEIAAKPKFDMQAPKVRFSKPQAEGAVQTAGVDVSLPKISGDAKIHSDTQVLGGINPSDVNLSFPGKTSDGSYSGMGAHLEGPGGKLQQPGLRMAQSDVFEKVKVPSADLTHGKQEIGISVENDVNVMRQEVHIMAPKTVADITAPKVDISSTGVNVSASNVDAKVPTLSMPKSQVQVSNIKGGTIKVGLPVTAGDLSGRTLNAGISKPTVDIRGPQIEGSVTAPKLDGDLGGGDGTFKMPTFKMPKFGFSSHNMQGPDVNLSQVEPNVSSLNIQSNIQPTEVDISGTKLCDINVPSVQASGVVPDVDTGALKGSISMPKFKVPKFGLSDSQGSKCPDLQVNLPKGNMSTPNVKVDGQAQNVTISGPQVKEDIPGPVVDMSVLDVNRSDIKVGMPKFSSPKFGVSDPKSNVDLELPKGNIEVTESKIDIKSPKITMPSLNVHVPSVPIPDCDLNLKGTELKSKVDIAGKKLEGDFKDPVVTPKVDPQALGVSLPKSGVSSNKIEVPGIDLKLPKNAVDISGAKIDIHAPEVNINGPEGTVKGTKLTTASVNLPSASMPNVDLNVKGHKSKGGVNIFGHKLEGDLKGPKLDIRTPEIDAMATDLDIAGLEGKAKGPKIEMPSMNVNLPKVSTSDVDLNLEGPKWKGNVDVSIPKVGGDLKSPKIDLKGPGIDVQVPELDHEIPGGKGMFKMPKFSMPKFGVSDPKVKCPDIDVKLPKSDIDISDPKLDVDAPGFEAAVGKLKGPTFKVPSVNLPKVSMPDVNVQIKEPKWKGDSDISGPKFEGDLKGPKVDMKGPKVNLDAQIKDLEGPDGKAKGGKFTMPKVSMPEMDLHMKGPKWKGGADITGPKLEGDRKGPAVDIEGPEVDILAPELDIESPEGKAKFKMPKLNFPKFGVSGQKLQGPDIDAKLPQGDLELSGPELDIDSPNINIEIPEGKVKGGKFTMPSINVPKISMPDMDLHMKGPKWRGGADISGSKLEGDLKGPKVDIRGADLDVEAPNLDIEGPDGKGKSLKFKMPSMQLPKVSMPDLDLNLKGPNWKGGADISGRALKGDLKGPQVDIKGPEMDIESPEIDIECPEGKVKGGKFKMPSMHLPNVSMPDMDLHMKVPKWKGDVDVSGPNLEGDFKGPNVDVKGPGMDINAPDLSTTGPDGKVKGPNLKMPSMHMPKISMPDFDLNLKGPNWKVGDVDISGPKLEGDWKGPALDIKGPELDINAPDIDIEGPDAKGKFKIPKLGFPKFGVSAPKMEGPDINIKLPKVDLDISGPKLGIETPDLEIDSPEGKVKGGKLKMPSMHMPKVSMPDFDINVKGPKWNGGDVDVGGPMFEGDIKGPKVDIKGPEIDINAPDIEAPKGKVKGPKFSMPSMHMPKVSMPDFDLNLKGPNWKSGDLDLSRPKLEGDLKGPALDIKGPELNVEAPDVDFEGPDAKGKFKMPKFDLPKFGVTGPKMEGTDINVKLPKGDLDITGPKLDIEAPDIDIEGPEGNVKGPHFKMPSVNLPKVSMPEFDLNMKGPKWKGGVDVSGPSIEGDLKGPAMDIKGPEIDVECPDVDVSGKGKFKMPKFGFPKFGVTSPKLEGDADLHLPKGDIDISGPKLDINAPEIDMAGPGGKVKGPNFKMPSVNLPDVDFHLKSPQLKGDMDISGPKLEGDLKSPKIDIKGPGVDISSPNISVEGSGGKVKGHRFKLPSWNFSKPAVSAPDIDINLKSPKLKGDADISGANLEGGVRGPELDIGSPKIDLDVPEVKAKKHKFRLPKFNFHGSKVQTPSIDIKSPKADIDISGPKIDLSTPDVDIQGPEGKIQNPKFKMPSLNITSPKVSMPDVELNLKGPKIKGDIDLPGAKIEGDIKSPKVDIKSPEFEVGVPDLDLDGPEAKGKVKMPKFSLPKFGMPSSKLEGADIDLKLPKGDIDISGPKLDIDAPEIDIEGPDGKNKGGKFKMPSMNVNIPKVSMPDLDLNLKGPKWKGGVDLSGPKLEGDLKGPNVDLSGPEVGINASDIDLEVPKGKVKGPKFSMPSMHMPKVSMPDIDLNLKGPNWKVGDIDITGPKLEGDLKGPALDIKGPELDIEAPGIDIEGPDAKGKFKMPKFGLPKFGVSAPKMEGPDIDVNLPKGELDISGPKLDIDAPDIDIEGPEGKVKGGKLKMPSMHMPKVSMPDFDINLKGPKWNGGDVNVSGPNLEGGLKGPKVDIKGPEADINAPDIDGPEFKVKGSKFKVPSMNVNLPKVSMPDIDLKGPSWKGGVDVSGPRFEDPNVDIKVPDVNLEAPNIGFSGPKLKGPKAEFESPNLEVDIDTPEIGLEGPEGNIKMPKVKKGKFGFGIKTAKPDITSPSLEVSAPEGDLNVEGPDLNIGVKGKKGKFKMPKLHMSGPKIKGKKGGFDVSVPGTETDVNLKSPDLDVDIGGPEASLKGDLNIKAHKTRKPLFGKLHFPDVEFDIKSPKFKSEGSLSSPKIEGEIQTANFEIPSQNIKGDIKSPGIDLSASGSGSLPDVNVEGPDIKLKKSKFKLPTFGMSGPKGSIDVPSSTLEANLNTTNIDLSMGTPGIKGPDMTLSGPNIEMPSVNVPPSKISGPDFDLNLKGPKVKGDLDVSVGIKDPSVSLDAPAASVKGFGGKVQLPKFDISGSAMQGMGSNVNVKLPKGDIDMSGLKISGGIGDPALDVNLKTPDVNIKGPDGKLKGPTLEMPSLNVSGPQLSAPDINLKEPKVKGDLNLSGNVQGPELAADAPDVSLKDFSGKLKMPKVVLSGSAIEGTDACLHGSLPKGDLDITVPKIQGAIAAPDIGLNVKTPEMNLGGTDGGGLSVDLSGMKHSGHDWDVNMKGTKLKGDFDIASDIQGPKMKVGIPDLSMNADKSQIKMPKIELPSIGLSGPQVGAPDVSVQGPQIQMPRVGVSSQDVNLNTSTLAGDLSGSFKAPTLDFKSPDVNIGGSTHANLQGPTAEFQSPQFQQSSNVNVKMPKVTGGYQVFGPKVTSEFKSLNAGAQSHGSAAEGRFEGPSGKVTFPKLKTPKFTSSGPELSGREVGVDVNFPQSAVHVQAGKVDLELGEQDVKLKKSKIKMPKFNFSRQKGKGDISVGSPEASIALSGSKGDLKSSKASLGSAEGGLNRTDVSADLDGAALSPKAKSSTFEFSLFRGKKPRHRSSSLSDERDLSPPTTPSGTLEAQGGTASMEREKGKGKHSKLKFGTFGGLGSKSKGSYEVTFSDEDIGNVEGGGVSLATKKSRLSSSSSTDSATKAGVRLPKVELTVAKKKE